jgi:Cdc6-like AAA superfamily ATPase
MLKPKTFLPLMDEFKPPKLLYRDEQLQKMMSLVYERGLPENLWLEGEKGLGKTLTCRCFADEVQARGNNRVFIMRCERSIKMSLENMCEVYRVHVPKKRLSPSSVARKIVEDNPNVDLLVFIIDEPEEVHPFNEVAHFTHSLYNALSDLREKFGFRFSICFASRILYINAVRLMEGRRDSRLGLRPVSFPPYNADQIVGILRQLLSIMFDDVGICEEEALGYLARHIERVGSDIREAKRALKYAIERSEDQITLAVMADAVEFIKDEWWRDQLANLPPYCAFLLYTAAELAQPGVEGYEASQSDVVDRCIQRLRALEVDRPGLRTIYYILSKIAEKGFFKQMRSSGFGNPIRLVFDKGDVKHIIRVGRSINWKERLT